MNDDFDDVNLPELPDEEVQEEQTEAQPVAEPTPVAKSLTEEDVARVVAQTLQAYARQNQPAEDDSLYGGDYDAPATNSEAREAWRLESGMIDEARRLYPDLPQEAMDSITNNIASLKTLDDLRKAKSAGLHRMIADHAALESQRQGKYSIGGQTKQPLRQEPVHAENPRRVTHEFRQGIAALEAEMGVKYDDDMIKEALNGQ